MKLQNWRIKSLQDNKLKNRFGLSNKNVGVAFYGAVGYWRELPKPEDIYDYTQYSELEPQNTYLDENKDIDNTPHTFTF